MIDRNYPSTVIEILNDEMRFSDDVLQAVQRFADSNPWRGNNFSRKEKFRKANRKLAAACNIEPPKLAFGSLIGRSSGSSYYSPRDHQIVLSGRLSVVTYLHEFGHALGFDERDACRWSVNLFRACFPVQYSRLIHVGHMLIHPRTLRRSLKNRNQVGSRRDRSRVS